MENKKFEFIPSFDNIEPKTLTENGALSFSTTGSKLADQFGKAGNHRGRNLYDVFADQQALWEEDPLFALRFPFYLRMVTRKTKVNENMTTVGVQKGQGVRDEAFKRMLYIAESHPDSFYKNLWMLPIVGSWKDVWQLMYYDLNEGHSVLNREIIFQLINEGLKSGTHADLIKKFMPRIKTNSKCTTDWTTITNMLAKEYAKYNGLSYREYNHLKTSGAAHDFQKLICGGMYKDINWSLIPGRALSKITTDKFLKKHELTKNYVDWLTAQPTVKFTGYVHELFARYYKYKQRGKTIPLHEKITIDKQFDELVKKATEDGHPLGNVWCALDTSGSMWADVAPNTTALDVCVSLGIFFSTLNQGAYHNNVVMFDSYSRTLRLDGTFCEKADQIMNSGTAWGSTNFQSIIDLMVRQRRKKPDIKIEDWPNSILVVSDMQFDNVGNQTNIDLAKKKLYDVFPSEYVDNLKFIWWHVNSKKKDFPSEVGTGQIFISGYDGSIISLLLGAEVKAYEEKVGRPITTEESIAIALSQEILAYIEV